MTSRSNSAQRTITKNRGGVATNQHPPLALPRREFVFDYTPMRLQAQTPAGKFMHGQNGIVARMVGIVDCRPIDHYIALEHRQKFGDRDRFGVRDQESVKRTCERRPTPDPNRDPGPIKVDRWASAFGMCV